MSRLRPLAATVLMAAVAVGWLAYQSPSRPAPPRPTPGPRLANAPAMPPAARELLAAPVSLAPEQRRALEQLAAGWEDEQARMDAAIGAARETFDTFMAEAARGKGASVGEIQARSADLQELSAALRARRAAHGAAAMAVLTAAQRAALTKSPTTGGGS